ncbi:DUF192 domain-containing protein [Patescibacteria group bacterium]|nr:DUF192 domain-containing protein [Patescibacteria group bacterium]
MRKIVFVYIALAIILIVLVISRSNVFKLDRNANQSTVNVNGKELQIEIAKSQKEKEIGLSKKNSLGNDKGMLFIFDKPGLYSFWMKNMKFPIDIIFLKDKKVVTVYKNVKPSTLNINLQVFQPTEPADKVLEVNTGIAEKNNIKNGTIVTYENIGN